jgi:phosphonate transport system substrate-binding protein
VKVLRYRLLLLAAWLGWLAVPGHHAAAASGPLEIGLFPYSSTRAIFTLYQPLQEFLDERLARPVLLVTAPDFRTFVERTQRGEYPLVITAPHFGRLAQTQAGYTPMLRVKRDLHGVLVANEGGPIERIDDLRGRAVSTPDRLAIISMLGLDLLRKHGLEPRRDVKIIESASHNSAVLSLQRGESAAAVISVTALAQMRAEAKKHVKVLANTSVVPHILFLAHPSLPPDEVARLSGLILEFADSSEGGATFIQKSGYRGLRPVTEEEMQSLDPYMEDLASLLNRP